MQNKKIVYTVSGHYEDGTKDVLGYFEIYESAEKHLLNTKCDFFYLKIDKIWASVEFLDQFGDSI